MVVYEVVRVVEVVVGVPQVVVYEVEVVVGVPRVVVCEVVVGVPKLVVCEVVRVVSAGVPGVGIARVSLG